MNETRAIPVGVTTGAGTTKNHNATYTGTCADTAGPEYIYEIIPAAKGTLTITASSPENRPLAFYMRAGDCEAGSEALCAPITASASASVVAGTAYYLFIDGSVSGDFTVTFQLLTCGNGAIDAGEQCDDGNRTAGDGCSNECKVECSGSGLFFNADTYNCYRYIDSTSKWSDAENTCKAWGGHLTSIVDAAEQTYVHETVASQNLAWIGARTKPTKRWADGTPWGYEHWATGEPNDAGGAEECGTMRTDGYWNDAKCSLTARAVCKRSPAGSLP